jgi:hypothetical protein
VDDARQTRVGADPGATRLLGEARGETDDDPPARGVDRAKGISDPAGHRDEIDQEAGTRPLQQRYRPDRDGVLASEMNVDRAVPTFRLARFDGLRGPGDGGRC